MSPVAELTLSLKEGWVQTSSLMRWFTKIVRTAYGWSDGIIAYRQSKANRQYKVQKADEEAYRIREEQYKRRRESLINGNRKRDFTAMENDFDLEQFLASL